MKIVDEKTGREFVLKCKHSYLENGELKEIEESLEDWIKAMEGKGINVLYNLEELLSQWFGKEINLKNDFPEGRRLILNLTGQIKRLPDNLYIEEISPSDKGGIFSSDDYSLEFGKKD